jgi:ribose 5-phosphate isomerase RpiB
MRIGIIQASSTLDKNKLLYESVRQFAPQHEVFNFNTKNEDKYSYIEISVLIGLLLNSGAVDFIVTGCSSGQGMMLAANSMPNVLCGYVPTPKDAYLFAQINNGNAVSLPLGEAYTYSGTENLKETIRSLFSEPFGGGYPKEDAERKLKDTELLKRIRKYSQVPFIPLLETVDKNFLHHLLAKTNVIHYIMENGTYTELKEWIRGQE